MLSDRRQRVLSALIEEYVARALPVGSRTLTERYHLGVSSATVRNELSVLEDGGYIAQPHTSAGRIPTDQGYRAFVDNLLMQEDAEGDEALRPELNELRECASELDALLEQTSLALTRLTDCLSVVIAPSVYNLYIKQLSLISLTSRRALVVLVTEDGQVFNRQMEFVEEVSPESLAHVQRVLSDVFAGKSMQDVQANLDRGFKESLSDPLFHLVLEAVVSCLQEGNMSRAHHLGVSSLLSQPEFSRSQALLPLVQVLEDDTVLLQIMDEAAQSYTGAPSVRIGAENQSEALSGVSVVASQYGRGESAGVVAVIGPTRMDYSKVINAVRVASATLDDL